MDHKIFRHQEGHIEIECAETFTETNITKLAKEFVRLSTEIEDVGKAVKVLVNSSRVKRWYGSVHDLLVIIFKDIEFRKLATFGANREILYLQHEVAINAEVQDRAKSFNTRQEAKVWLFED